MTSSVHILAFAGSLRRQSYNRGLIRAAQELVIEPITIETFDIEGIPLYNGDIEHEGFPPRVIEFRKRISEADALLIATPEYNYSVPGVLKNAIDWASRPPDQPFRDKPVAMMGATPGGLGTTRAQHHLRQSFVSLDARVLARPEVLIARAAEKFDSNGNLTDEPTRKFIGELLTALAIWTRRLR